MSKEKAAKLATAGRAALARVESLHTEIAAKGFMSWEAWRDYALSLIGGRQLMPSDKVYGRWVHAEGLDKGLAKRPGVRSDAIWMAENWDALHECKATLRNHHPSNVRQECRDLGYPWAFEQTPQNKEKARLTDLTPGPSDVDSDPLPAGYTDAAGTHSRKYQKWFTRSRADWEALEPELLANGATRAERAREALARVDETITEKMAQAEKSTMH